MKMKKNKMTISCSVETEVNFKAICDLLNKTDTNTTINGSHSNEISKFMTKFFKTEFKKLSMDEKIKVQSYIAIYKENKTNNGIFK